jgi:hypothetical protein
MEIHTMQSSSLSCFFVPRRPKYLPQHSILKYPQPMLLPKLYIDFVEFSIIYIYIYMYITTSNSQDVLTQNIVYYRIWTRSVIIYLQRISHFKRQQINGKYFEYVLLLF